MTNLSPLLATGLFAFALGAAAAIFIVRRDLAPRNHLSLRQSLALSCVLGAGVLAFGAKLMTISLIGFWGAPPIKPRAAAAPLPALIEEDQKFSPIGSATWRALPDAAPAPADNPTTPEKIALGRMLFHDKNLSRDGSVSCASCHELEHGGADRRALSLGVGGQTGARNAPSVYNAAFQARLFWDGRARSLEEQALGPLSHPKEMANSDIGALTEKISRQAIYRAAFKQAFGAEAPIDIHNIARALAAFERALITPDTPYDRLMRGQKDALTAQQLRGMALFEKVGCIQCHGGPNFSQASVLVPDKGKNFLRAFPAHFSPDIEKYGLGDDKGAAAGALGVFRPPSLRNVALTAPYFHNGAVKDLREAVRIMARTQTARAIGAQAPEPIISFSERDGRLIAYQPKNIRERDIDEIVAFLESLTSEALARENSARHTYGPEVQSNQIEPDQGL